MPLYIIVNFIILSVLSIVFSNISIVILGAIFSLIPIFILYKTGLANTFPESIKSVCVSLSIGIFYMFFIYVICNISYGKPYYCGGSDDLNFENAAKELVDMGVFSLSEISSTYIRYMGNSKGYLLILVWIIRISESIASYHTILPRLLNLYLLLSCALLIAASVKNRISLKTVKHILYSICLFPNAIYISSFIFRDVVCSFFLCLVFYLWNNKKPNIGNVVVSLIAIVFSYYIRDIIAAFCLVIIGVSLILKMKGSNKPLLLFGIVILGIVGVTAFFYFMKEKVSLYGQFYTDYRNNYGYGLSASVFKIPLFPFGIIARFSLMLISPVPVNLISFSSYFVSANDFLGVINSLGTIYQIYHLPYFFRGLRKMEGLEICCAIIIGAACLTFTFRHVILFYPFLLTSICLESDAELPGKRKRTNAIITLAVCMFCVIYMIAKL